MIAPPRTVVDLSKVSYARLVWRNGKGDSLYYKPRKPTVHGIEFNADEAAPAHEKYPNESMIDRAKRLGILDEWHPVIKLQFANTHRLEFVGDKALSLWEAWNAKQFGKKKEKKV